jgi:hypothetical protein
MIWSVVAIFIWLFTSTSNLVTSGTNDSLVRCPLTAPHRLLSGFFQKKALYKLRSALIR